MYIVFEELGRNEWLLLKPWQLANWAGQALYRWPKASVLNVFELRQIECLSASAGKLGQSRARRLSVVAIYYYNKTDTGAASVPRRKIRSQGLVFSCPNSVLTGVNEVFGMCLQYMANQRQVMQVTCFYRKNISNRK